jgi:hypothetical protein
VIAAIGSASWFLLQRHSTKPLLSLFRFRAIPRDSGDFGDFGDLLGNLIPGTQYSFTAPPIAAKTRRRGELPWSVCTLPKEAAICLVQENDRCSVL